MDTKGCIKLTDDYYVKADIYGYSLIKDLKKQTVDKNGIAKDVTEVIGYYGDIKDALVGLRKYFIRQEIKNSKGLSLEETIKVIYKIDKKFEKLLDDKKLNNN